VENKEDRKGNGFPSFGCHVREEGKPFFVRPTTKNLSTYGRQTLFVMKCLKPPYAFN